MAKNNRQQGTSISVNIQVIPYLKVTSRKREEKNDNNTIITQKFLSYHNVITSEVVQRLHADHLFSELHSTTKHPFWQLYNLK